MDTTKFYYTIIYKSFDLMDYSSYISGGYHRELDLVLVLDVARFKYPPFWVPLKTLWEGMEEKDSLTGECRGYFVISAQESVIKSLKDDSSHSSSLLNNLQRNHLTHNSHNNSHNHSHDHNHNGACAHDHHSHALHNIININGNNGNNTLDKQQSDNNSSNSSSSQFQAIKPA